MKTEKNILIAFILNSAFVIFEIIGGILTGSIAVISDSVHDIGDAVSIGISYFFEKKSKKPPDEKYTYGYVRFSVLGGTITTLILFLGSVAVIVNAITRFITPAEINYNGMIIFAFIGICVNTGAAITTKGGDSMNQRAVNLHMLEDVIGWVIVLTGAVVMRFTDFILIDPIISVVTAVFILITATKNLKEIIDIFLEKAPDDIDINQIKELVCSIDGVTEVHHIHVRSIDKQNHYASMHIVSDSNPHQTKEIVRQKLHEYGITHLTLELETPDEECQEKTCHINSDSGHKHCHSH